MAAASIPPLVHLQRAFETFVDAVASARLAAGNEAMERELRFQAFPEDRIMERFIERGVNLRTTVQESLMWLGLLPEARGLQAEWVEYKRSLSQYPAVRRFFAGYDYDRLYADRCYASITYVMLDDNRYWRATLPHPPSLPRTLAKLSRAIFDLDMGAVAAAAKNNKKRKPVTSIVAVDDTATDLTALRADCLRMLDEAQHQSIAHFNTHRVIVSSRSAKFNQVHAFVEKARMQLQEADDGLTLLLVPPSHSKVVTEYTDGVFDACAQVLTDLLNGPQYPTLDQTSRAAADALQERAEFVEPQVHAHVFTHHRQAVFERHARALLARQLHEAASALGEARDLAISAKAAEVFQKLYETAHAVSESFAQEVEIATGSLAFDDAQRAYTKADARMLARILWTNRIIKEPDGHIERPGSDFDARRLRAVRERHRTEINRLKAHPAELRSAAQTHATLFIRNRVEAAADISRLTVNDSQQSNARAFLHAFTKNLADTVLPSLRRGQTQSVEAEATKYPVIAPLIPNGVAAHWPVDLPAFHALRTVMLELAKGIQSTTTENTQTLVEVLRIESMGRAGSVPTFEMVWSAVARLWVLLLTQEQAHMQKELLRQLTPSS